LGNAATRLAGVGVGLEQEVGPGRDGAGAAAPAEAGHDAAQAPAGATPVGRAPAGLDRGEGLATAGAELVGTRRAGVDPVVFAAREHLEVRQAVVESVAVEVVDDVALRQLVAELAFDQEAGDGPAPAVAPDEVVARAAETALTRFGWGAWGDRQFPGAEARRCGSL